ncbi:transposase, partial [Escherichia coli]
MSGKRYPEEFKTEAVKQVVDRGYSVASVATRLDITTHSLYAWIKKYGPDSSTNKEQSDAQWICPYISRHLLSLNPLLAC